MWAAVCRDCMWASGEAYLKGVADYMAMVHAQDSSGHKVAVRQAGQRKEASGTSGCRAERKLS
jgi:hypothetical protein